MEKISIAIVGGGAAGLLLAASLKTDETIRIFERGERLGRKLSATGNGQGNLTNRELVPERYFTQNGGDRYALNAALAAYDDDSFIEFLRSLGVLTVTDERGRVYPSGRQASALTDALRFAVARKGVEVSLQTQVVKAEKRGESFLLTARTPEGEKTYETKTLVLCTGGKAAKNFGTDGSAYALAQSLGHTLTPLYPSLVQLKTDTGRTKMLKGIRVADAGLTAQWTENGERKTHTLQGDVIFTDYGVSGDAVFRISAFVADKSDGDVRLFVDLLPAYTQAEIRATLENKRAAFPDLPFSELLCGILNNQVARVVMKTVEGEDLSQAAQTVKAFPLAVKGTLGFDYAQVTKGGVPLSETDENFQSTKTSGLYLVGELLDVDGECGGYNLQWAYASARTAAAAIDRKYGK